MNMKSVISRSLAAFLFVLTVSPTLQAQTGFTNSIGMKMLAVPAGKYIMGSDLSRDYWDQSPAHEVTISQSFHVSETEVTVEQYKQFDPDYDIGGKFSSFAGGVSWYDATAFCKWLSEKEGKPYRLPTEAEWEYVCRAGTTTLYAGGQAEPAQDWANAWGVKNMHTGVREWCYDWYGDYQEGPQTDPVGSESGMTRVVRGGCLDNDRKYGERKTFNASANRASIAPAFGRIKKDQTRPIESESKDGAVIPGSHWIGFRVVQAPMPATKPAPAVTSYASQGVHKNTGLVQIGPDSARPYFRKRYLLPVPLDNSSNKEIDAVAMHPSFRRHNHSPALEVCPNGDILLIIYTSYHEREPEVTLIASRLRFGCDQWDMPDRMFGFAAANNHAPLLWTDGNRMHIFWGSPGLEGGFPFQWRSSDDSGATWDEVKFPNFISKIGPHSRQPINTAFRDREGTLFVASDVPNSKSVLWASRDNGQTWFDTEGRSAGRHTTYALLGDGKTILGMGGKNSDIEGYMPKAISADGGKTWAVSKTPFPMQAGNQRPSILRLKSGRLFFAGDFQALKGQKPDAVKQDGSYVALSEDDGQTWILKSLVGALPHENTSNHNGHSTIGYSAARQSPNGMIHLITTMNRPCLHFELNEAWILSKEDDSISISDEALMASSASSIKEVREYRQAYPDGKVKTVFFGGTANDGRFLLHGKETWYYPNGGRQREAMYDLGRKIGTETYWLENGQVQWKWDYQDNAMSVWTQYWPNGQQKARSSWRNFKCCGLAWQWDQKGNPLSPEEFVEGKIQ